MRSSDSTATPNNSSNLTRTISNGTSAPIPIPGSKKNSPKSPQANPTPSEAPLTILEMPKPEELILPSLLSLVNATKDAYERIRKSKEKTVTHKLASLAGSLAGAIAGSYADFEDTSGEKRKRLEDFANEYAAFAQEQKGTPEERQTIISKIYALKSGISKGQSVKILQGEIYFSLIDVLLSCAQRAAHDKPAEALNFTYFSKLREPLFILRRELNNPQDPYFHILSMFFSDLEKYFAKCLERDHKLELNASFSQIQKLQTTILRSPKQKDPAMAALELDELNFELTNAQHAGSPSSSNSFKGTHTYSDTEDELDETKHTNSRMLLTRKLKDAELEIEELKTQLQEAMVDKTTESLFSKMWTDSETANALLMTENADLKRQLEKAKNDMSQSVNLNAQLVDRIKELEAATGNNKSSESKAESSSSASLNAEQYGQHGKFGGSGKRKGKAGTKFPGQTQQSFTSQIEKPKYQ